MPFTELVIQQPDNGKSASIKASLLKPKKVGLAKLVLTMNQIAVDDLQWSDQRSLRVLIGDGKDHGKLRIRPDKSGNARMDVIRLHQRKDEKQAQYFKIWLGHVDAFVNRSEHSACCAYETQEDGWVEITLPAWSAEQPGGGVSEGGLQARLKQASSVKPKWNFSGVEEDILRYLSACDGHAASKALLVPVVQLSEPSAGVNELVQTVTRMKRKLDGAGCTIQSAGGGSYQLIGAIDTLFERSVK